MGKFQRMKVPHMDMKSKALVFKKVMTVFFAVFQIQGIITVSFGIWLLLKLFPTFAVLLVYCIPACLTLTAGSLTVLLCTVAIVTIQKVRNQNYFCPFMSCFTLVLILELFAVTVAIVNKNKLNDGTFLQDIRNDFDTTVMSPDNDITFWVDLQESLHCCGLEDYTDWISNPITNFSVDPVLTKKGLESCECSTKQKKRKRQCSNITSTVTNVTQIYDSDCYHVLLTEIDFVCLFIEVFCSVVIVTQITTFMGTMWILAKMQRSSAVETYKINFSNISEPEVHVVCPRASFQVDGPSQLRS